VFTVRYELNVSIIHVGPLLKGLTMDVGARCSINWSVTLEAELCLETGVQ
jgi:hypothetical protein